MEQLENKIIYQIYPKSFLDTNGDGYGDLQGIIEKLDYIAGLGVDYLWLSPVNVSPQHDNGYDIADYYNIDPMFGTKEEYRKLIALAKQRGIKIMMDLVLNHTSTDHPWFQAAIGGDFDYQNFYFFADQPNAMKSVFTGSAWNYVPALDKYYFCFYDKTQADLNWDNKQVRQALYDVVNYWIGFGVEGFRLDVILDISKDLAHHKNAFGPHLITYIQELQEHTFGKDILTVGECWNASNALLGEICNEKGLTQAFRFRDITLTSGIDKWDQVPLDLSKLAAIFDEWQNGYEGNNAIVMNNHDLPRLVSLWLDDQKYRKQSVKLLLCVFGFLRGNLYLYQGEEIGMINAKFPTLESYRDLDSLNKYAEYIDQGGDPDAILAVLKQVSRDNARIPMQWSSDAYAGFSQVTPWIPVHEQYETLNVECDRLSTDSLYRFYQEFIGFRKLNYDKLRGKYTFWVEGSLFLMESEYYKIVANFSGEVIAYEKAVSPLFTNYAKQQEHTMRAYEVYVYQKK